MLGLRFFWPLFSSAYHIAAEYLDQHLGEWRGAGAAWPAPIATVSCNGAARLPAEQPTATREQQSSEYIGGSRSP